ncbi:MAG: DNA-directed RNA polymerase subunit alpha [Candidatus Bostrichicola ureolyticus]|nr:MAG: DNA-directed RNA polymerase subunit alpha [Candidatus Bostrichicola ureolyticus]
MEIFNFVKPEKYIMLDSTNFNGIFQFQPLEPGFGCTIGNAMRRVLLSSLEGFAITYIKIIGITHEFSPIKGVVEDVTEIILNLKQVRFKKEIEEIDKEIVTASITDKEQIIAGDFNKFITGFKVINTNLVICNKDKSVPFNITFCIEKGIGYVPANSSKDIGTIAIDAIYTPIINVKYTIENCRVGQKTDFENLLLYIQTDGSISPKDALNKASKILIDHFLLLSNDNNFSKLKSENNDVKQHNVDNEFIRIKKLLKSKLTDTDKLSRRTLNCLHSSEIETWADVVSHDKNYILRVRNFGKKCLSELEEEMNNNELYFGMDISKYEL